MEAINSSFLCAEARWKDAVLDALWRTVKVGGVKLDSPDVKRFVQYVDCSRWCARLGAMKAPAETVRGKRAKYMDGVTPPCVTLYVRTIFSDV